MRLIIPIVSVVLAIAMAAVVWLLEERNFEQRKRFPSLRLMWLTNQFNKALI